MPALEGERRCQRDLGGGHGALRRLSAGRRRWRRSRCSRPPRASRRSGSRSATRTGWRPLGLPQGPCRSGGIAAWRLRPPGSARVGALGCAGAKTKQRDTPHDRASGTVHRSAAARGMARARVYWHARVCGACRIYVWGRGVPARPGANAARTRLSTLGLSCRISLPIYCIWRVRAPCPRSCCAASTASWRGSGRSSRASWVADRATSWTPSACNACASRLRCAFAGRERGVRGVSRGASARARVGVLRRCVRHGPCLTSCTPAGPAPAGAARRGRRSPLLGTAPPSCPRRHHPHWA